MLAATSRGLFRRTGPFVEHAQWTPVDFGGGGRRATDVVAAGARLWVAAVGASGSGIWTSANGAAGPFQQVELPGVVHDGRRLARLGLAVAPSDPTTMFVLGSGPRLWRVNGVTPTAVVALPQRLFDTNGNAHGQSAYDLAVAVHPDNSAVVVVGGSTVQADVEWSASLFRFTVAAAGAGLTAGFTPANQASPATDPTFIGYSVHADVHQAKYVKVGAAVHLWVACDGGVFRSVQAGDPYTFAARNSGLAVLQPGYLACHPVNPAFVLAGTQDNGLQLRIGESVWVKNDPVGGDGGGVVVHPLKNRFFAAQVHQYRLAQQRSAVAADHPRPACGVRADRKPSGVVLFRTVHSPGGDERAAGSGVEPGVAGPELGPGSGRDAVGDAARGRDPRAVAGGVPGRDTSLDVYGEGSGEVIACKWATENRLWVLIRSIKKDGKDSAVRALQRPIRVPATGTGSPPRNTNKKCGDFGNGDIDQPTSSRTFRRSAPGATSRSTAHDRQSRFGLRGGDRRARSRPDGHALVVRRERQVASRRAARRDVGARLRGGLRSGRPGGRVRRHGTRRAPKRAVVLRGQPAVVGVGTVRQRPAGSCRP